MGIRLFSARLKCKKNATHSSHAGMRRTIGAPQVQYVAQSRCALSLCFQCRPGGPVHHDKSCFPLRCMPCYSSRSQSKMVLSF